MEKVIDDITNELENILTIKQSKIVNMIILKHLNKYNFTLRKEEIDIENMENFKLLDYYIKAKSIEGCSSKTVVYYKNIITKFLVGINLPLKNVTTENVREYLASYRDSNKVNLTTIDNVRRIFSSFFSWLEDENYIIKNPVRRIHKIKTPKKVKKVFSDENIEMMRDYCKEDIRNLTILEFFLTTGIRVGEMVNLDIKDVNFNERSCIVLGKGNKQREVYFDAKTKIHLQEYLESRNDENEALFVSKKRPHKRLSISGIELIVRKIGSNLKIEKAYPHKFRRTLATMAIDKGMPIEQVQKILGHVKIETTMHYAMVNQNNVKTSHRKYIG